MSSVETEKTYGLVANPLNNKLIADLRAKGADVLVFPAIKAERIELSETDADYIVNLTDYDWLIFTDVFAADCFIENLLEFGIDFYDLDDLTICAVGEAVADRLRFAQVHADVIPSKTGAKAVFAAIKQYVVGDFESLRMLVVCEERENSVLVEKLRNERAKISELPIYRASFEDEAANVKLKTLLKGGAVDEFVFSSSEDVLSLKRLLGDDFFAVSGEMQISAASEIVYQTLQENGFRPLYFH